MEVEEEEAAEVEVEVEDEKEEMVVVIVMVERASKPTVTAIFSSQIIIYIRIIINNFISIISMFMFFETLIIN